MAPKTGWAVYGMLFIFLPLQACTDQTVTSDNMTNIESNGDQTKNSQLEDDLAAIERLHQADMEASKNQDFETLRSLLTDDIVAMPPGSPPISGFSLLGSSDAASQIEVIKYQMDFSEVVVLGNYAHEWGRISGAARTLADEKIHEYSYNVMRILKKGPDGEWRVHRTIWNEITAQ